MSFLEEYEEKEGARSSKFDYLWLVSFIVIEFIIGIAKSGNVAHSIGAMLLPACCFYVAFVLSRRYNRAGWQIAYVILSVVIFYIFR